MTTHKTEYCDWHNISQCTAVLSSNLKKTLPIYRAQPTTRKKNNSQSPGVCLCVLLQATSLWLSFSSSVLELCLKFPALS